MPLKGPGLDTQKCVLVGSTRGEVQNPGDKRPSPLAERLALQMYIIKSSSKSHVISRMEVGRRKHVGRLDLSGPNSGALPG